ncbi:hypothetical protein P4O66_016771 [Electrophorus voltai]|uniref:Signal-induced proliferation-associated 1-like protein C-terminal domain-containing protein n=1 Tax=Electrophorus voltai TaxID=2609070 RepID=A0AAD9DNK7_9TELE|nr:hypothetical protein P4O66_016771 [Electrophorus voltai]
MTMQTHFLHSGYFHSATESSAFSPYTKDHKSKYRELQDQCSSHSGKYGCIAQSSSPPPLAQPGFYSPKIPRSKHCEPSLFSTKPLKVCSPTENITHTLPLSNSKIAVLKQRTLLFCSQVDITSKNVFGQPRVVASLRPSCSPQPIHRSTIVEDLKKLIVMDDTTDNSQDDPTSLQQTKTPGSPSQLQKHDSASPSPLMLASHVLSKQPLCRPSNLYLQSGPRVCQSISGLVESEVWDMDLQFDHGLLPVLNTAHGLDRNHLVKAAEVYEMQREANLLYVEPHTMHSGLSPVTCSPSYSCQNIPDDSLPVSGDTELLLGCFEDNFVEFPDPLSHLEMTLRKLSSDLVKEKKNKVALMAEVLKLRMSNQHLKEESLSANAQLQKIYQMFNDSKQNNV